MLASPGTCGSPSRTLTYSVAFLGLCLAIAGAAFAFGWLSKPSVKFVHAVLVIMSAIFSMGMLLSFVLLYASVQINCINIRNAAKMELNNVSARIYADTFHSQREANLTSYMADINLSTAYKNALRAGFIEGMKSRVKLTNDDYDVENIDLTFHQYSEKIEYVASFDITYQIRMFGTSFPPIRRHAELTGSHNTKF